MSMCFGSDADRTEDFQGAKGAIMFRFDSIKWYDSYPEIRAIEQFMDHMHDIFDDIGDGEDHYRFVRTGEEYEDIEQRGYAFDIYPSVGIDY